MSTNENNTNRKEWAVFFSCIILLGIVFHNITLSLREPRHLQPEKELTEAVIKDQSQLIQNCVQKIAQLEKETEGINEYAKLHESLDNLRKNTKEQHQSIVTARITAEKYLLSKTNEAQSRAFRDSVFMALSMAVLMMIVLLFLMAGNHRLELKKIGWKKWFIIVLIGVAFAMVCQRPFYRLALSSHLATEGFKASLEYGQAKDDYMPAIFEKKE